MMALFLWYSCEDEGPLKQDKDESAMQEGSKLSGMTKADKLKYFGVSDLSTLEPGYTYTFTDTLSMEELKQIRRKISVRSSYSCGINVELFIYGPADTARVTVYEANKMIAVHGPVLMVDGDDFDMTVDGDTDYDFKVEPIDNPTASTNGNLIVDPDWGGKTVYYFSGASANLFEDYHFECPPESLDGTCDAYVSVDKYSGSASGYILRVDPDIGTTFQVTGLTGNSNQELDFTIDEDRTYDFDITTINGGSSETFSVEIIRPDGIAHVYSFYSENMSGNPWVFVDDEFDYFQCPY